MAHSSFRLASSLAIISLTSLVGCQSCYYPNGNLATIDQPCSTSGDGPCCPLNWECLDNGLCYLSNANYFERRTCTDQTWRSPECPNICTQNGTATGNEAILQCSPGRYCCDGNRSWDCCAKADTIFFPLVDGTSFRTIGNAPVSAPSSTARASSNTPTTVPTSARSPQSPATSVAATPVIPSAVSSQATAKPPTSRSPSISSAPTSVITAEPIISSTTSSTSRTYVHGSSPSFVSSAPNTPEGVVTVQTVTSSNSQGIQTVYITNTPTPTNSADPKSSRLGIILGCAIGIPVGIAALSLLAFLLLRRRRKQARSSPSPQDDKHDSLEDHPPPAGPRQPETGASDVRISEIYGKPVQSPGGVLGKSELDTSASDVRTSEIYGKPVQSPAGVQGKSELAASPALSQTSSLPAYSPNMHTTQWSQPVGGYQPYRPIHELPGE